MKLSVVIIANNEERNLPRCLASVQWADEIVLVDSGSTDNTVAVAGRHGARVVSHEWRGFGPAKREGVRQANGEWILSIDADEEVTSELAREIQDRLNSANDTAGFYIPRRTRFLGRWMMHGGWYPDYILRLFRRDRGNFDDAAVHESVSVTGATEQLKHDLLHYSYPTLDNYFEKFNGYTTLAAEELYRKGKKAGASRIVLNPIAKFLKQYCLRAGFLDGLEGLVLALLSSGYVLTKYAKLRDLHRRAAEGE